MHSEQATEEQGVGRCNEFPEKIRDYLRPDAAKQEIVCKRRFEGKEYDICSECWESVSTKAQGKGRAIKREIVLLPPPRAVEEHEEEERPGEPPKIWGAM